MYLKCFWINIHTPKISCCRKLKNLTNNFNKDYLWLELPWGLIAKLKFAICKRSPFVSVDKLVVRTTMGLFIMKKRNQWGLRSDGTRVRVSKPGGSKGRPLYKNDKECSFWNLKIVPKRCQYSDFWMWLKISFKLYHAILNYQII